MFAYKDTELTFSLTVKDAGKLAKLSGKLDDWCVKEVAAIDGVNTDAGNETVFRITFMRSDEHKV